MKRYDLMCALDSLLDDEIDETIDHYKSLVEEGKFSVIIPSRVEAVKIASDNIKAAIDIWIECRIFSELRKKYDYDESIEILHSYLDTKVVDDC